LALIGNKRPPGCFAAPPSIGVRRRKERKKAKIMGWDKSSLTEQRRKLTVTTIILIRRIYKTNSRNAQSSSHLPMPGVLLSHD